jgi:ETS translocation variant 6/7
LRSSYFFLRSYRFLRNPTELKSIKNISLLRQSMSNSQQTSTSSNPPNSILTHQQKQSQLSAMISSISNSLQHSSLPTATTTSGQTILDLQKPPFHRQSAAAQQLQMQRQTASSSPDDSLPPPGVSIKMETTDMVDDNKPTDLSLSMASDRKFGSNPSSQFYP